MIIKNQLDMQKRLYTIFFASSIDDDLEFKLLKNL